MSQPWTTQRLRTLVASALEPISPGKPGGVSAKTDKSYERILAEVSKLESPAGGAIDWKAVATEGQTLLAKTSKDLLISAYVALGLLKTKGLPGLLQGLATLWGIVSDFWDTAFPEVTRLRGRANAIDWVISRIEGQLGEVKLTAADRDTLDGLFFVTGLLQELNRERFGQQAPALGPLSEVLERMSSSLPAEPGPEADPTPPSPPPLPSPPSGHTLQEVAPPRPPPPPPVEIGPHILLPTVNDGIEARLTFVTLAAEALVEVAHALRAARLDDPAGYRLLRVALWLPVSRTPAADEGGRTELGSLSNEVRHELEQCEANDAWHDLLRSSERALERVPLALCLQRYAATALAKLNLTAARLAVLAETRALLTRLPALSSFKFSDGSPLVDDATREWLEANALLTYDSPRPVLGPKPTAAVPAEEPIVLARRAIAKSARAEALAQADLALKAATCDRERFAARLVQAQACALAGNVPLAAALFDTLDKELVSRGLELWEPALAAEVLRGILSLGRGSPTSPEAIWGVYQSRLFLVDSRAALDLKPPR